MTAEQLEAGAFFGRYTDVDKDGIPYRTYPGTHPDKGAYFTRGTSRDAYARYSERGPDYLYNMQRLMRKFDTAKSLVPQPVETEAKQATRYGVIHYGSTGPSMHEAIEVLEGEGVHLDTLRIRAFPFPDSVAQFIARHELVYLVEQNRDAQLRGMLVNEFGIDPARIVPILHYDGTPITARFIAREIGDRVRARKVTPMTRSAAAT
jgi:2-oxoglutarate ferredoxin oxidoreductase subunit alpha